MHLSYHEELVDNALCNLVSLMEAENFSQRQVGEDTGIGQATISKVLHGTVEMSLYVAACICDAYEIYLWEFLGDYDGDYEGGPSRSIVEY